MLEKDEADMQLSAFILISETVVLKFALNIIWSNKKKIMPHSSGMMR